MRLLYTKSLQFKEFFDNQIPKYAILSHRWEEKEVTFQDFEVGKQQVWPGFVKIRRCCSLAESRGFDWVWIDACCIDNKSSAELSEAINSMYRWYEKAGECYAYLSDVRWQNGMDLKEAFGQSVWFTRGWTLQELLAPDEVILFDYDWNRIGEKLDLMVEISAVTGIRGEHLFEIHSASVATKMSWISRRQTSRMEDIAYCLLGIFDVNMPLLYGEGGKAFLRLELEITKKSDDDSIFAWSPTSRVKDSGLLALWPSSFADSADIEPISRHFSLERRPYSMTNKGLELTVPQRDLPMIVLDCYETTDNGRFSISIKLRNFFHNTWYRVEFKELYLAELPDHVPNQRLSETQTIYMPQDGL